MLVDECPAGVAMDAAVAKALGMRVWSEIKEIGYLGPKKTFWNMEGNGNYGPLLSYSTDIAAAWELISKMQSDYVSITVILPNKSFSAIECCIMKNDQQIVIRSETAPLAISRAFLKANGVTEIETPEEPA